MRRRDFVAGLPLALAGLKEARAGGPRAVSVAFPMDVRDWIPTFHGTPTTLSIVKCVFDQPLEMSADLKLTPSVVTGYQWLDKTGQTLQLDLRRDVTFHNGSKLTSDDIRFTYCDYVK